MKRNGDFYLTFYRHTVRLHVDVFIKQLKGKFNYSYESPLCLDYGVIDATVENITAKARIDWNIFTMQWSNPNIKSIDYGYVLRI